MGSFPQVNGVIHLTLKMTSAQVVETSVANNSSFQNYPHPDDHTIRTTNKSFVNQACSIKTTHKITYHLWINQVLLSAGSFIPKRAYMCETINLILHFLQGS